MQITSPFSWRHEFARSADADRYREIVRRAQEEVLEEKRRKDKERNKEERDSAAEDGLDVLMATAAELASFDTTVNVWNEATYEALIENEQERAELLRQKNAMLEKAFVLPDGTRVFESEDGVRVFDEFGNELDAAVITADEIEDWRPRAEGYLALVDREEELAQERTEILEYQAKVDDARERAHSGEITSAELREIEQELAGEMPESVREHVLPEYHPEMSAKVSANEAEPPANAVAPDITPAPLRDTMGMTFS